MSINDLVQLPENKNKQLPAYFDDRFMSIKVRRHLERFKELIDNIESGYKLEAENYQNDLARRLHLENIYPLVPAKFIQEYRRYLSELDQRFLSLTYSTRRYPPLDEEPYLSQFWWERRPLVRTKWQATGE